MRKPERVRSGGNCWSINYETEHNVPIVVGLLLFFLFFHLQSPGPRLPSVPHRVHRADHHLQLRQRQRQPPKQPAVGTVLIIFLRWFCSPCKLTNMSQVRRLHPPGEGILLRGVHGLPGPTDPSQRGTGEKWKFNKKKLINKIPYFFLKNTVLIAARRLLVRHHDRQHKVQGRQPVQERQEPGGLHTNTAVGWIKQINRCFLIPPPFCCLWLRLYIGGKLRKTLKFLALHACIIYIDSDEQWQNRIQRHYLPPLCHFVLLIFSYIDVCRHLLLHVRRRLLPRHQQQVLRRIPQRGKRRETKNKEKGKNT